MKVRAVALKRRLQRAVEREFRGMSTAQQLEQLEKKFGHPRRRTVTTPKSPTH